MLLANRVAIITGASRGIGNAVARGFAAQGARVVLNYIDYEAETRRTVDAIIAAGGEAIAFKADVTRYDQIQAMVAETLARFGRIDILVNNAAIYPRVPWYEITEEQWDQMLGINLKGTFLCCKAVYPTMKAQHYGRIINVSSVTFWKGHEQLAHYVASKGGVIGFTRTVAREVGKDGIGINAITPGAVLTETELELLPDQEALAAEMAALQCFPERILPDDLVGTFVFLASEMSAKLTGQTINVDGGWIMH